MSDVNVNFPPSASPFRPVAAGEVEALVNGLRAEVEGQMSLVDTKLADTAKKIEWADIREFGAKKSNETDGLTVDNIKKINDAINFVSSYYGKGTVWIPDGEFIIDPATSRIILKSNVTIDGVGTLKVKDEAGNYETIFGAETNGTFIKNVHFKGFKVDQNPLMNTTCRILIGMPNTSQFVINFQNFVNITVNDVNFDKCSGVNTVLLSGRSCKDAQVNKCEFSFLKPINHSNYDNSAVYFNCENHKAIGNNFYAPISEKAGGAIESHNGLGQVIANTSDGYNTVCNVVSSSIGEPITRDDSNIIVAGNIAEKCSHGIRLWSITGMKLSNVIIANNTLSINNKDRGISLATGISMFRGTGLEGDYENISIAINTIKFQKDNVLRADISESSMFGIGLAVRGNLKNIFAHHNTIINAPVRAIKLGIEDLTKTIENAHLQSNIIVNAGIYEFASLYYRAAIQIEGTLKFVSVEDNNIYDDNDVFGGFISIDANTGTFKDVSIKSNKVSSKQGGYYYRVNKSLGIDEGEAIKTHYSTTFPPTSKLQLKLGDKVENIGTLTPGTSYTGYRVTTAGTSGTIATPITGTCTNGSNIVTVSDSSQLRVGDMILIAGSGKAPSILQITGNTLLMSSTYTTSVTDGSISYYAPVLKGYGQLQA